MVGNLRRTFYHKSDCQELPTFIEPDSSLQPSKLIITSSNRMQTYISQNTSLNPFNLTIIPLTQKSPSFILHSDVSTKRVRFKYFSCVIQTPPKRAAFVDTLHYHVKGQAVYL